MVFIAQPSLGLVSHAFYAELRIMLIEAGVQD